MKKTSSAFRTIWSVALLVALALGLVLLLRATTSSQPHSAQEPTETVVAGYPPAVYDQAPLFDQPTETPVEGYPPPYDEEEGQPPEIVLTPEPTLIEIAPGMRVMASSATPSTPWPTFTPYPSPTMRPGPTDTPIPLVSPAPDAAGTIQYLTRQIDGPLDLRAFSVDSIGKPESVPVQRFPAVKIADEWIFLSPDGKRLAFTGMWGAGGTLDFNTGLIQPFSPSLNFVMFYNWFPDSIRVLIKADDGSLRIGDPTSGEQVRIVPGYGDIDGAAVSPDGSTVVYSHGHDFVTPTEVWMVNADGRDAQLLFDMPGDIYNFAWSPDGKEIAFLGDGLMVMDANGLNLRKLGNFSIPQCYFTPPLWSPDSRSLAIVVSTNDIGFCNGWNGEAFNNTDILLIDVQSGESHPLLADGSTGNIDPAWSPDGSQVAFVSDRSGSSEVWVVNADGSDLRQLTDAGQFVRFPVWRRP
jgi:Tol biopolymer transport system component